MSISLNIDPLQHGEVTSSWSWNGTTYNSYADGTRITFGSDGSLRARYEDGSGASIAADGSGYAYSGDWSEMISVENDGAFTRSYSDGSYVIGRADGSMSGNGGGYNYWSMDSDGHVTAYDTNWHSVTLDQPPIDRLQLQQDLGVEADPIAEGVADAALTSIDEPNEPEPSYPLSETLEDGSTKITQSDGTYTIDHTDGSREVYDTEGNTTLTQRDGSYSKRYQDGSEEQGDAQGNATRQWDDGSYQRNYSDGSVTIGAADGTYTRSWEDGTQEVKHLDGSIETGTGLDTASIYDDQTTRLYADGTLTETQGSHYTTYYTDGSVETGRDYGDGPTTSLRTWDDGSYQKYNSYGHYTENGDADGNVRREYEDGSYRVSYADGTREQGNHEAGTYTREYSDHTYESRLDDGSIENGDRLTGSYTRSAPDGSYQTLHRESLYMESDQDYTESGEADGSYQREYHDGATRAMDSEGGYTHRYSDGRVEQGDVSGHYTTTYPDGSVEQGLQVDGELVSYSRLLADGSEQFLQADGLHGTRYVDGDYSYRDADGNHYYRYEQEGVTREHNLEGDTIVTQPDGSSLTLLADGSIITKDSDGTTLNETIQHADGSQTSIYYPSEQYGDGFYVTRQQHDDGSVTESWGSSSDINQPPDRIITQSTLDDGTIRNTTEYADGRVVVNDAYLESADITSSSHTTFADGSESFDVVYNDGTRAGWSSDGSSYRRDSDGNLVQRDATGRDSYTDGDGNQVTLSTDGSLYISHPDGSDEYIGSSGFAYNGSEMNLDTVGIHDGMPEGIDGSTAVTRRDGYEIEDPEIGATYIRQLEGSNLIFADSYQADGTLVRYTFPATERGESEPGLCLNQLINTTDGDLDAIGSGISQYINQAVSGPQLLQMIPAGETLDFSQYGPANVITFTTPADALPEGNISAGDFRIDFHNGASRSFEHQSEAGGQVWDVTVTESMFGERFSRSYNYPESMGGSGDTSASYTVWDDGKGSHYESDGTLSEWSKADGSYGSYREDGVDLSHSAAENFSTDPTALRQFVDGQQADVYDLIADRFETLPSSGLDEGYDGSWFSNEEGSHWGEQWDDHEISDLGIAPVATDDETLLPPDADLELPVTYHDTDEMASHDLDVDQMSALLQQERDAGVESSSDDLLIPESSDSGNELDSLHDDPNALI